jgi:hypothetical protein
LRVDIRVSVLPKVIPKLRMNAVLRSSLILNVNLGLGLMLVLVFGSMRVTVRVEG